MSILRQVIRSYKALRSAAPESHEAVAYHCLLNFTTYRITKVEANDPWIGFRFMLRTLRLVLQKPSAYRPVQTNGSTHSCLIAYTNGNHESMVAHIAQHTGEVNCDLLLRELAPTHLAASISNLFAFIVFSLAIALRCLKRSEQRGNLALIIPFTAEIAGTVSILQAQDIQHVYEWDPYTLNSNWQALFFRKSGIEVTKLPSPGPLSAHHRILIADELILSTPYQEEEIDLNSLDIRVGKISRWSPEGAVNFATQYAKKEITTKPNTIGFYSHAGWLRQREMHSDDGLDIPETEQRILLWLRELLEKEINAELIVFCHPREKSTAIRRETTSFYQALLGKRILWRIMDWEDSSHASFSECHVGISAYSTIIYERLYCGFPMIIGRSDNVDFPVSGSRLRAISFGTKQELSKLIEDTLHKSPNDFFSSHELLDFRMNFQNTTN